MVLVFANRKKLAELPSEVREAVEGLTPAQFAKLRASISGHDHFDFEQLPMELREMIYTYVVLPTSNVLHREYGYKVPCPPILLTSKTISQEASTVMYRNLTFETTIETNDYSALRDKDEIALRKFRNFDIEMTALGWHIHEDKKVQTDLAHALRSIAKKIASRDNKATAELNISFLTRNTTTPNSTNSYYGIKYHEQCNHGLFHSCQQHLPGTTEE